MQVREVEPPLAPRVPLDEGTADMALTETVPQLKEMLGPAAQSAHDILEAEEALRSVRERFEQTVDPEVQGELATEALEHVERQLQLIHERRRGLDRIEAKLWSRQNRLEGFLIRTRGSAWWHAHRDMARTKTSQPSRVSTPLP
jgi:hypothetical protein